MEALDQQLLFAGAALLCASAGSVMDVRERRIPNWVTGPAIAGGLILHGFTGGWHGLAGSALAGAIAGGIFLVFYLAEGMGGGDVKLMAAVGCIDGLAPLGPAIIATAIAGAVIAFAVSVYHGRMGETVRNVASLLLHYRTAGLMPHPNLSLANRSTLRIPYAVAIAVGCLFTYCNLAWGARW